MSGAQDPYLGFTVVGDELQVGGIALSVLAARVGQTPFYAYDRRLIAARVAALRHALPREIKLHYAMKANPMPAVVRAFVELVDGLDLASGGELTVALDAGADPLHTSFAGPGKSRAELEQAVAAGVLLNVESFREIKVLAEIAHKTGSRPRIAVRVNPDFELKSSGMKMGGGPKQFGIDAELVPDALAEIGRAKLGFEGFHIYSGSQNLSHEAILDAQRKVIALAARLGAHAPAPVRRLNLGGGFGIPYFKSDRPLDLAALGAGMADVVEQARALVPEAELVVELGRYLIGEAGIYVCRVVDRKPSRGEVFLVTDGGLHHHLAASGNFGQVIRKNYPVAAGCRLRNGERETVSVVGPLCTPLDILGDKVELGRCGEGDLIVVFQSGAYGFTASPHHFLSHPSPVEVLV